jgi:hypothetical protein
MKRLLFSRKPPPLWVFAAALMLWWLGCAKQIRKFEEEQRQKAEAQRQVVKEVSLQLATLRVNFPDLKALAVGPCPDSEIKEYTTGVAAKELEAPGYFTYTEYDLLETYANPNLKMDDPKIKDWGFMETEEIRALRARKNAANSESDSEREEAAKKAQIIKVHRYVVVFRSATKELPLVREVGPFSVGTYDGWAALFDLQQPTKPLCAGKIAFTSSDKVGYYKERKNLAQAVALDFRDRFREAAKQTISKLSPSLRANNF